MILPVIPSSRGGSIGCIIVLTTIWFLMFVGAMMPSRAPYVETSVRQLNDTLRVLKSTGPTRSNRRRRKIGPRRKP